MQTARVQEAVMSVTIEYAQNHLLELIAKLKPGQELVITQNARPIARLIPAKALSPKQPRVPGSAVGQLVILKDDDEHLKDFAEYMQ